MSDFTDQHIPRIRSQTTQRLSRKDLAVWIIMNTFIGGRPFSFKDHEFQARILQDMSQEIVIMKSAQLGLSEMSLRFALAMVMLMPDQFAIGYTFPTARFASHYSKSRFDPIVRGSPALRHAVKAADLDNADAKSFGPGRFIFFKGAAVGNAAISDSLDLLIHDELDFSDPDVVGDYTSRLIHSLWKLKLKLSTPTYPGGPIDSAFQQSRRNFNFCKCRHCNHQFIPDYYEHVKIPGWDKHLDEINRDNLHAINYRKAQLLCPACHKPADLSPEHRQWVTENPDEPHIAAGYKVSPFDAPKVITLSDLIEASTSYGSKAKFRQFSLGIPAADADSGLTDEDLDRIGVQMAQSPFTTHVMGIDLGLTCHFTVGGIGPHGQLVVVHYERVPLKAFRERYWALKLQFRVSIVVSDIQPYTDLIMSMSNEDPNLYGARYVTRQGLEVFDVKVQDPDIETATPGVREVSVNRNAVFDKIMSEVRPLEGEPGIVIRKLSDWDLVKKHMTDMKRASATLRNGEFTSLWAKSSKGNDHYHHALAYLWIAAQMRGIAYGGMSTGLPGVSTFKVKEPAKKRR